MQNLKDKTFFKQDNLYNFPYIIIFTQRLSEKVFKPFRVHFWLYDYIFLINFLIEKITNYKHDKFLDFGCGDGRFIYDFQKKLIKNYMVTRFQTKLICFLKPLIVQNL